MNSPDDPNDAAYCELPTPKDQRAPSTRSSAPLDIRIDADSGRFVAEVAGAEAFIQYRYEGADVLHLIRTWVPPQARGGGVGALLAEFAMEHAREEGLTVTTSCWFIDQFLDASPQYQDLRAG
ncbi:GNAT family N-acetyltransferase [Gaopeijia maritima]|uniref:GNAT family N-acetyltransferase n=2 Tax=Gaopeijia maritima TaxID=3119007 RepID=A0ABU9E4D6_9BACT